MSQTFSEELFREVFAATEKVRTKIQPFLAKYKQHNMNWIMRSFDQLHRLFSEDKVELAFKFNAIFGIKFMFDTGDMILVNLIEIYFLPKLLQIVTTDLQAPEDKRGTNYFLSLGYTKQSADFAQKCGYSYVRMASQFILNAAVVKPKRIYEGEAYNQPSDYFLALKKLQDAGWKMYATPAYYKQGVAQGIKTLFEKSLAEDNAVQNYINYYTAVFKKIITEDKPTIWRLDPMKILEYGDTDITAGVVRLCDDFLRESSLKFKKNALYLLNYLIKWGDIEAAHLVNCSDVLDDLLYEVANAQVKSKVLSRGKSLFKQSKADEQMKQQLYNQLLKDIQFWSLCYPNAIKAKNRQSKIKMVHDQFRGNLQLEFPVNKTLKQDKATFDAQIVIKKNQNRLLLQELKEVDPQPQSYVTQKKGKTEEPTPSSRGYDTVLKFITEAETLLNTLCESQGKAGAKIDKLLSFSDEFQSMLTQNELSDGQFDTLAEKGDGLLKRIKKVVPHLQKFRSKQITFQQLSELILGKKESPKKQIQTKPELKPQPIPKKPKQEQVSTSAKKVQLIAQNQQSILPDLSGIHHIQSVIVNKKALTAQTFSFDPNHNSEAAAHKNAAESRLREVEQLPPLRALQPPLKQNNNEITGLGSAKKDSIKKDPIQTSLKNENVQKEKIQITQALDIKPASHTIIKGQSQKVVPLPSKGQQSSKQVQNSKKQLQKGGNTQQIGNNLKRQELVLNQNSNSHPSQQRQDYEDIKVPDSIKNAIATHKNENNVSKSATSNPYIEGNVFKRSHTSSRSSQKGSQINFEESRVSKDSNNKDQDDLILMPENNPLQRSFHKLPTLDQLLRQAKTYSFKKCFQDDKYLFGQERNNKKYYLASATLSLIKPKGPRTDSKSKNHSFSIPEILDQRNKKYNQELKYVQKKKDLKINELQQRLKSMQADGKVLSSKIEEREKQIRHIRASSQADIQSAKKNSILQDQNKVFQAKIAYIRNKTVKQKSLCGSQKKQPKYLDPLGKLINTRKYNPYFQQFQTQKQKKSLLKNKDLLLKTDDIQFGCMSKRDKDSLVITFYITPSHDLADLVSTIESSSDLDILVQSQNIPFIKQGKQEKLIVKVSVLQVPYTLPTIEFTYVIGNRQTVQKFLIPCSFHKFLYLNPVSQREMERRFEKKENVLRGEEVPYTKKLLKSLDKLSDYFPNGTLFNGGNPNDNGQISYGGKSIWQGAQIWIRLMLKKNHFIYVQTVAEQSSVFQQFFISLTTNLLKKNIELKEM